MNRCCGFPLAQPAYESPMETATSRSPRIPSSLSCRFIITGLLNSTPRHGMKRKHRNITDLLLRSGCAIAKAPQHFPQCPIKPDVILSMTLRVFPPSLDSMPALFAIL